ncbi:thermonuclease family protein [Rhodobium gokarnense]|uniref:Endonuclease YncB(Thermonuclease family) n=1 Tax=Rhodobium gokarnense TaxID=364296 RepID=A0ABT3H9M3_9HYPH|nr:thermonuclease family protein [Rhodobium gokarnense]MCW2307097.1 endonuclease YncB(thermonuclease family) [Rhodobium gokarnense]
MRFLGYLIVAIGAVALFWLLAGLDLPTEETPDAVEVTAVTEPAPAAKADAPEDDAAAPGPSDDASVEQNIAPAPTHSDTSPSPAASQPQGRMVELPPARNVTPKEMTQGPVAVGPTLRLPGPPPPLKPKRPKRFFRVVVSDAGTIDAGDVTIKIADVETPELNRMCTDANGKEWPCGLIARTALRRLIRIRAIECAPPAADDGATITTACKVGPLDIATWLVGRGWAKPTVDNPQLVKARDAAKAAKRGLWR